MRPIIVRPDGGGDVSECLANTPLYHKYIHARCAKTSLGSDVYVVLSFRLMPHRIRLEIHESLTKSGRPPAIPS
jgi:hypothetical protein